MLSASAQTAGAGRNRAPAWCGTRVRTCYARADPFSGSDRVRGSRRLGTDSPLTAEGGPLDEIRVARELGGGYNAPPLHRSYVCPNAPMTGSPCGHSVTTELVVIGDGIRLIGPGWRAFAALLPDTTRCGSTRGPSIRSWNVPRMIEEAAQRRGHPPGRTQGVRVFCEALRFC
jgi:hypothetical protein